MYTTHTPASIREQFREAVSPSHNAVTSEELKRITGELWNCADIMPSETCEAVGVPQGSSYAQGARRLRASLHRRKKV
jgi:hypothetical protein